MPRRARSVSARRRRRAAVDRHGAPHQKWRRGFTLAGARKHVRVCSDLGVAQLAAAGDPDDVTLELGRERPGRADIFSCKDLVPQTECQPVLQQPPGTTALDSYL